MPLVSIIVPVYNSEVYLEETINSLRNQTLSDIEIICIDDGSTDNSLNILKSFEATDNRVKVFSQKNKGQSAARNKGLEVATGDFIGFLDSDDLAKPEMFEKLYNNAISLGTDISMCSISVKNEQTGIINENDSYLSLNIFPEEFENRAFSPEETFDFIFRICVTSWNKIYKKSFLDKNNLKFTQGLNFEDNLFFLDTFLAAKNVCILKENLILYRIFSETSYSRNSSQDYKKLDFFEIMKQKELILKKYNVYSKLKSYFNKYKKGTLLYWFKKIKNPKIKLIYALKLALSYLKS